MSLGDNERIETQTPQTRHHRQGGAAAVLRLLVPVVLGGVTVFGVYFLFLDDFLKLRQPNKTKSEPQTPADQTPREETSRISPPQPTFAPESREQTDPASKEPTKAETTSPPRKSADSKKPTKTEREAAAKNTLGLAEKMEKLNPEAASKWYRKVVDEHPDTKAAQRARDWLKKQAGEP